MPVTRPQSTQPIPPHARRVFKGAIFDVYQWQQQLYDGTTTTFEKLVRPDTVVVFPILSDGRILLTVQQQPGKTPFIGAPAGRVEEGEDVVQAARRELLEESGYEASEMLLWHAEHPTSKIDWVVYLFVARGLKKSAEISPDGGEKIELMPVTFEELLGLASDVRFIEKEAIPKLYEARCDVAKERDLRRLMSPL